MRFLQLTVLCLVCPLVIWAQDNEFEYPSLSPQGQVTQIVGYTEITVDYERPSTRGREIFGNLVPWDEVWRTGAGNATRLRFSEDVEIEGHPLKAGYYSLFTIPRHETWTIILHRDTTLYGSYRYNAAGDVLRAEVPAGKTDRFYETLTIDIDLIPNDAVIYISWGNEQTKFKVKTTTDDKVMAHISEELKGDGQFPVYDYANAATYLSYQNLDLDLALEMAEKSVITDPSKAYTHAVKIELLVKMGKEQEAKEAAIIAKEITSKKSFSDEGERQAELAYYDTLLESLKE